MLLTADLTSTTLVSLTLVQLLTVLGILGTFLVGVVGYIRKDERDCARLDQLEKENNSIRLDMRHLVEQVDRMAGSISLLTKQLQARARPTKTKQTEP